MVPMMPSVPPVCPWSASYRLSMESSFLFVRFTLLAHTACNGLWHSEQAYDILGVIANKHKASLELVIRDPATL